MTPRFTVLLDWVEGRLPATEAAQVAQVVQQDARAQETVAWIEEFSQVAEAGRLAEPPEALRASLRSIFARAHGDSGPGREGSVSYDTREGRVQGVRSASVDAHDLEHVIVSDGPLRIVLTLVRGAGEEVDVRGRAEREDDPQAIVGGEVVLVGAGIAPRAARLGTDASFSLPDVSSSVSELWFFGDDVQFRCRLSLERG